ncbi:MAG: hypothetical protein II863_09685 [Kiritimatiellae bacterium]|nr:hypothetical protein [Kiritimatiellia bacterium]MBR0191061.1 hypothetical protein [Thermoguttaceae bacterium]
MNTWMIFARAVVGAVMAVMASTAFAEWNDAHWHIREGHKGDSVVEILNMNKMSYRVYAFDRSSGALKYIKFNVTEPEKFYINGESSFAVSLGGKEAKAEFVSFDAKEREIPGDSKAESGRDVLAAVESRYRIPEANLDVSIVYRFRRDNEVRVDCSIVSKAPLPAGSRFSMAYPISRDYEVQAGEKEVHTFRLARSQDEGRATLTFCARTRSGNEELRQGLIDSIFSPAPKGKMNVTVTPEANKLSPTHDRLLRLSSQLCEPVDLPDGSLRYPFNFSIPLIMKN